MGGADVLWGCGWAGQRWCLKEPRKPMHTPFSACSASLPSRLGPWSVSRRVLLMSHHEPLPPVHACMHKPKGFNLTHLSSMTSITASAHRLPIVRGAQNGGAKDSAGCCLSVWLGASRTGPCCCSWCCCSCPPWPEVSPGSEPLCCRKLALDVSRAFWGSTFEGS